MLPVSRECFELPQQGICCLLWETCCHVLVDVEATRNESEFHQLSSAWVFLTLVSSCAEGRHRAAYFWRSGVWSRWCEWTLLTGPGLDCWWCWYHPGIKRVWGQLWLSIVQGGKGCKGGIKCSLKYSTEFVELGASLGFQRRTLLSLRLAEVTY